MAIYIYTFIKYIIVSNILNKNSIDMMSLAFMTKTKLQQKYLALEFKNKASK